MNAVQNVTATAGFAYGVIGADIHVFGDGSPVYLLEEHSRSTSPDADWMRELPRRMLDARSRLVPFTGRDTEVADLDAWLSEPARLMVRWLSGSGGQGKTRLVEHVADRAQLQGWKVAVAVQGVGTVRPSPGSQDLDAAGCPGVLLVVDYADRWSLTSLIWLSRNSLLHHADVPTRVLLAARGATNWRALRGEVEKPTTAARTSLMKLEPLPATTRVGMYAAASAAYARVYGIAHASRTEPTVTLADDRFGLTLAVHLAALVMIDATVNRAKPVTDPAQFRCCGAHRPHLPRHPRPVPRTRNQAHHHGVARRDSPGRAQSKVCRGERGA